MPEEVEASKTAAKAAVAAHREDRSRFQDRIVFRQPGLEIL